MEFYGNKVYILIEGQPNSPEIPFLKTVIRQLINRSQIFHVDFDLIAVGGSQAFNAMARLIYEKSNVHKRIPVLAITDRDFKREQDIQRKQQTTDHNLVNNNVVRELCWPRHEWENYLLEETDMLAEIFNQLPIRQSGQPSSPSKKPKLFKRRNTILSKTQLDNWLKEYFQHKIKDELIECLKFRFNTDKICPQLENVSNDDILDIAAIKNWFLRPIEQNCQAEIRSQHIEEINSRFEDTLAELDWETWLNNPSLVDFDQAKRYFRGKEAFENLFEKLNQEVDLVPGKTYRNFIKEIMLPEMEHQPDCLLIQELGTMLLPYFEIVA
ncbi:MULTISPECIES: hypothetical protein [Planktothricoides]|uniref:DUF4435 domain-containing protein n=1 Tax=Planktothricoides raciborskii FACHB-1370 TaxID=2949576 RepID=A0ABR8EBU3_9CYAN|nr:MULTISPECIES: hypothetical protein [Planktothricoides]KOR34925.1 hypothetical protein AM228_21135 [Planktothricoides sp. SR001]MBD2544309.1 hypothetical protein [Planktothricoides raciborskii FACHB-1370]MBD2582156.1 hypothetical protein [Planktothricoides raciborskii FACHB-1261]